MAVQKVAGVSSNIISGRTLCYVACLPGRRWRYLSGRGSGRMYLALFPKAGLQSPPLLAGVSPPAPVPCLIALSNGKEGMWAEER